MPTAPKPKPFYTIQHAHDRNSEYAHLHIRVFYQPQWSSGNSFEIVWQADRTNTHWYGLHVETRASSNEEFALIARLIAKLKLRDAKPEDTIGYDGENVPGIISQLRAQKIVEKQYHNGLHEYFSEAEWPHGSTYRVLDGRQTQWAEVARDEDAALRKFTAIAGARIAQGYGNHEFALRWLNEGKPVVENDPPEVWAPKSIEVPWAKVEVQV